MPLYQRIAIAQESSFGSPDANGKPDASGLTYLLSRAERLEVITSGDDLASEDNRGRAGPYNFPSIPQTTFNGSPGFDARLRRSGTLEVTMVWYGYGARTPGPAAHPAHMILTSSLADAGDPTNTTDTWEGVSATQITSTAAGSSFRTGDLYGVTVGGTYEVAHLTRTVDGASGLYVSPALSTTLAASTSVRALRCIYLDNDLKTGTAAERTAAGNDRPNSLAIRLDGIDHDRQKVRTYMVGARMQSARLTVADRLVKWTFTIYSPFIYDDHSNAAVTDPTDTPGPALHALGSSVVISDHITGTAPAELGRTALNADANGIEVAIEFEEMRELGATSNALGCYDVEPINPAVTASVPLTQYVSALDEDFTDQKQRHLQLTFAPGGASQGTGGAVEVTAGTYLSSPSKRPQVLEMTQGKHTGDNSGGPAANSPFVIGFGM